jgi:hypothetical protein
MDFYKINRSALVVKPKPALIEWANDVFPEQPLDYADMDQHDEADIFLLPDFEDVEDILSHLKANVEDLLSVLLEGWSLDESDWPETLDWALFERFYDYHVETMVTDTIEED